MKTKRPNDQKEKKMIVKNAYTNARVRICRKHYENPCEDITGVLGGIESSLDTTGCVQCEVEAALEIVVHDEGGGDPWEMPSDVPTNESDLRDWITGRVLKFGGYETAPAEIEYYACDEDGTHVWGGSISVDF